MSCAKKTTSQRITHSRLQHVSNLNTGSPKIYTTTGFGPTKNTEMAGVDHLVVYIGPNPVVVYIFGVPRIHPAAMHNNIYDTIALNTLSSLASRVVAQGPNCQKNNGKLRMFGPPPPTIIISRNI